VPIAVTQLFISIETHFRDAHVHCLTGWIPLHHLSHLLKRNPEAAAVVFHAGTQISAPVVFQEEVALQE